MTHDGGPPSSPGSSASSSDEDRLAQISSGSLGDTIRRGAAISAVSFVVVQMASFAQIVVLARLLSPAEIGLYAAGTVLTGFVMSFSADGMAAALVQRQDEVDDVADTVFWATMVGGLLSGGAVLLVSPLISLIFRNDVAGLISATTAGTLFLHSLTVVPDALMQRRFNFKRKTVVMPTIAVSYAASGIVFAALGFGVWSLVWAAYVSHICWLIATWSVAGWRPGRGRPSLRLWRQTARYSSPLIVGGMIWHFREIFETVIVGRRLGDNVLGQYRYGRRLCMLPAKAFADIAAYVLLPAFSRMATDLHRLRNAYLRALSWVWLAAVPVAGITIAVGEPLVVLLLGQRWREAGLAFVMMSGFALGEALGGVADQIIKGSGHSRYIYWVTAVGVTTLVGFLLWLSSYGLVGVGLAISASSLLMGLSGMYFAGRITGAGVVRAVAGLGRSTLAAVLALVVVWPLEHLVLHTDERTVAVGLVLVAGECALYLLVYAAVVRLLLPAMAGDLFRGLRRLVRST